MLALVLSGMSIGQLAIAVVIIAAVIALVFVALQQFGVSPPSWVMHCLWICVVAVVVIVCIRFLMSL